MSTSQPDERSLNLSPEPIEATTTTLADDEPATESLLSPPITQLEPVEPELKEELLEEETLVLDSHPGSTIAPTPTGASSSIDWPSENTTSTADGGLHYSTHLWHGIDAVIKQSEQGRLHSKATIALIRTKAELDREYARKLRSAAETFSNSLGLPTRPRSSNTFQAGACALRNICVNIAANGEMLAEKLEEEVADVFKDEIQDLAEEMKPLLNQTKATVKEYRSALNEYESAKRNLMKTCQDLEDSKYSTSSSKNDPVDFLTDFITPSTATLEKRVKQQDKAYMDAIKQVREIREDYDQEIAGELDMFEKLEKKRMDLTLGCMTNFTKTHQLCFTSHLKNITAVHQTLSQNIKPANDIQAFVQDVVKSLKQPIQPSPLPVYRLFKGHPQFKGPPGRKSSTGRSRGGDVDEPLTDSDDDSEEELTLSDHDGADVADDGASSSDDDGGNIHEAIAQKSLELTTSQQDAIRTVLEKVIAMPALTTDMPVSPLTLEPDLGTVLECFKLPAGRTAFAQTLKKFLPTATVESKEADEATAASSTTDASGTDASAVATNQVVPQKLYLSGPAFEVLLNICISFLDAAAGPMHVQPVSSLIATARLIESLEEATDDSASSSTNLGTRLVATHALFASVRFQEAAFLATLDREWRKRRTSAERWQSEAEQAAKTSQQRYMAFVLLSAFAQDLCEQQRLTDREIVELVAKMSAVNQFDADTQQQLVSSLPCFQRLNLTEMPVLVGAAAKPLVASSSSSSSSRSNKQRTPLSPTTQAKLDQMELPVAQPIRPIKK